MKQILDVIISLFSLILLMPISVVLCLLIKSTSPGSIFYKQIRVGRNGIHYQMYKFRSMYENSEHMTGPVWATKEDKRITSVGRIMRKFHLDEIPQFINVLSGHMSIIGPRPERPEIIKSLIKDIPSYLNRTKIKPGMTGWAQIRGSYDNNLEDVNIKLKNDFYYMEHSSFLFDIKILLLTLLKVMKGQGV